MTELKREIGLFSCTMLVAGNIIGIGIFITAGRIYHHLPHPAWVLACWLLGGFLSFAGALAYAELGTRFPRAGGNYIYLRESFGPFWAFLAGFSSSLVTLPGTAAFLAIGFTRYAEIANPLAAKSVAIGLILLFSLVNYWGVKWGAELQDLFMVLKILLIVVLAAAGFFSSSGSLQNFFVSAPFDQPLWTALPLAMVPVMYTYSGWDATAYVAGEMKHPARTIPLGVLGGVGIVTAAYVLLAVFYLYAIPVTSPEAETRIATAAAGALFGTAVGRTVGWLVALSILGCLSAQILTAPRVLYAMAKDGLLPRAVGDVHPLFATPAKAILIQALWSSLLVATNSFDRLLDYVTVPSVFFASVTALALFRARRRDKKDDGAAPYRMPGYPWLPALFAAVMGWIVLNTCLRYPKDSMLGLFIVSLGVPVYFFLVRKRSHPR